MKSAPDLLHWSPDGESLVMINTNTTTTHSTKGETSKLSATVKVHVGGLKSYGFEILNYVDSIMDSNVRIQIYMSIFFLSFNF